MSPTGEIGLVNRELNQMVCRRRDPQRGRSEVLPTAGQEIRMAWQRIGNEALASAGHRERIDMRSHAARGITEPAGKHRGPKTTREMREQNRSRSAEPRQPRERAPARRGPTEREAGAVRDASGGRTIGELRAELAEAGREMAALTVLVIVRAAVAPIDGSIEPDAASTSDAGVPGDSDDSDCSCSTPGARRESPLAVLVALVMGSACLRRRRSA